MHLLERYALGCGVKIDKPFIYDKYFPLPIEKYITLQPFSKYPSKCYDYWNEVVSILNPIVKKLGITIVQIGGPNESNIEGCINIQGQTSIPQCAYIVKNSLLHFGVDSFAAHIASGFNKKIVCMYSSNYIENASPYWSNKEDLILLSPDFSVKKPSFATIETPKSINTIKPETIVQAVLDLLGVNQTVNRETLYIGETYGKKTFEWIPNCLVDTNSLKVDSLICRYDLLQDIECVKKQTEISKLCIVTDQPFELQVKKEQIKEVVFFIDKEKYKPGFNNWCRQIDNLGIKLIVVSKHPEHEINDIKMDFMDVAPIFYKKQIDTTALPIGSKVKYKSRRLIISKGKMYPSEQAVKTNASVVSDKDFVVGEVDADFLKEAEYFYVEKM
jgi:hypothetical protein